MGWMMRNDGKLKCAHAVLGLMLTFASTAVFAYGDDKAKEICRDPKIQEFNLPEFKAPENREIPPESEFSFIVSAWSDAKKIKVTAKNKPVSFEVESNDSFHKVKGKIPAEYTGQYLRLNVRIPALLGCYSTQGWLLKVATGAKPEEAPSAPADSAAAAKTGESTAATTPADAKPAATAEQEAAKPAIAVQPGAPQVETKTDTPKTAQTGAGSEAGEAVPPAGQKPASAD